MAKGNGRTGNGERAADEWAADADERIDAFFDAKTRAGRADALRGLLTAMMGFGAEGGDVPLPRRPDLPGRSGLPARAELLASREGMRAVFVPLPSSGAVSFGIGRAEATAAAAALAEQLGDDLLLAMLSADGGTMHLVRPDGIASDRIVLRRIPFGRIEREGEVREGSRRLRAFGAGGGGTRASIDAAFGADLTSELWSGENSHWRAPARFGHLPPLSLPLGWDGNGYRSHWPIISLPTQTVRTIAPAVHRPRAVHWRGYPLAPHGHQLAGPRLRARPHPPRGRGDGPPPTARPASTWAAPPPAS